MEGGQGLLTGSEPPSLSTLAWNFFVLGATAFGGPAVHISMFKKEFVENKRWMPLERFMELFAMANCLPGPSSTQVAYAIGITQGGIKGGLVSGFMFSFPGMIFLTILGFVTSSFSEQIAEPKSAANGVAIACSAVGVSLVFIAVVGLVKKVVFDAGDTRKLGMICCGSAAVCMVANPPPAWLNPVLIILGGAITIASPVVKEVKDSSCQAAGRTGFDARVGVAVFALYFVVAGLTIYGDAAHHDWWFMDFLTAGMFVWGGGPVVLPMLMTYLTPEWISPTVFLTGIAFAEMSPGPVFNMSCYLGVQIALASGRSWLPTTALCWAGLMGPGVILVFGAMPLWEKLRKYRAYQLALPGLNAACVGLLVSTVFVVYGALEARSPWPAGSRAMALLSYCALEMAQANVPLVVVIAGILGFAWSMLQSE